MWNYCVIILVSMTVPVLSQDCNFDSNGTLAEKRCRWEIRLTHDGFDWLHATGPTPHPRTGPLTDFSGNGGYLYAPGGELQDDGSITQWRKGSRTHFVSPIVHTERTPKLVRFYYYMYGSDVGILNVFIIVKGRKTPKPQWRKTGDKGNLWKLGEVTIPSNSTARVVFEAVPTRNVAGDIAIDEITFTGPSPSVYNYDLLQHTDSANVEVVSIVESSQIRTEHHASYRPTLHQNMAIDCDFEGEVSHPSCNFIQATDDQFDWMPNAGKTPTKKTGPPVDHTRGTSKGVYMYLESTGVEEGDTCVLITTRFQKEIAPCTLNFYYYMQGTHVGSLHVFLVTEPGVLGTALWSRDGAHGGTWREVNIDLNNVTGPYSIAFKGIRGDGANGDIAIDDIKLLGQECLTADVMPALEAGDTYWDYCDSSPCTNNGTCVTRAGDYTCVCPEAWTGKSCETEVPEGPCRSQPCMNDGTCNQEESNGTFSYTCVCPEPYDGDFCEIDLDAPYCESQPCLNGGRCKLTANGYQCLCLDGWNGTSCENDIDECLLNTCQNGGNCTNTPGGFSCECPVEWHGPTCADECVDENTHCAFWAGVNECKINPKYMLVYCKRSCAVCGDYECVDNDDLCPVWAETGECGKNPFYMLVHCHLSCEVCVDDECRSSPCWNGGTCVDGEDSYTCLCADGFYGTNCENNTDECASNPCQNNATCVDGINGFTCNCTEMYEGNFCEHKKDHCSSGPCQNNGTCNNSEEGFTCSCQPGFEGDYCEINIDECASSPCENDGVCIDKDNGFLCNCTEAWVGVNCDLDFDECKSNPCQNGGLCYHGIGESLYFCDCLTGWTGEDCTEEIDECESTPCQNGGTCVDELDSYTCTCHVGYTGLSCEAELLECASDPCMNDGRCVENVGSFTCLCPEGYVGDRCEYEVNQCQSSPCLNGGTCLDRPNGHLCECPGGYSGRYCETVIPIESSSTPEPQYSSEFHESYDFYGISEKWNYIYSFERESEGEESESYLNPEPNVPTTVKDTPTTKRVTLPVTSIDLSTTPPTTMLPTVATQRPPTTTQRTTSMPPTTTRTVSTRMPPTTTATTSATTTTVEPLVQTTRNRVRTTTPPSTSSPTTTVQRTTTNMKESTPRKSTKGSMGNTLPPKTGGLMTSIDNRIDPNASSKQQSKPLNTITIAVVGIIAFIVLVVIIVAVVAYRRYQQGRTRIYEQFDMESKEDCDFTANNDDFEPEMSDPTESNSFKYSPM